MAVVFLLCIHPVYLIERIIKTELPIFPFVVLSANALCMSHTSIIMIILSNVLHKHNTCLSEDQQFFLLRVWNDAELFRSFLRSGLTLAFIPVFSEAVYWMSIIFAEDEE